jgi:FkbM family methyltransferase
MEETATIIPLGENFTIEVPRRLSETYLHGYEPFSRAVFSSSAIGCDVVLDIGAHMGFFSMVSLESNPSARLIAVEASPQNFNVLSRNLNTWTEQGRAKAIFGAFGGSEIERELHLTENIDNCGLAGHPISTTSSKLTVPGINSESLGIASGSKILAKVDVEGYEFEVVQELLLLERAECELRLLIEFNPKTIRHAGFKPESLLKLIFDAGYRVFLLHEAEHDFVELESPDDSVLKEIGQSYKNIYCLPKKSSSYIAAFLHCSGFGGAEKSHAEVSANLISLGHMVRTYLPLSTSGYVESLRASGSAVNDCSFAGQWWARDIDKDAENTPRLEIMASEALDWVRKLNWSQVNLVLTQSSVISIGALVALYARKPHIWWLREFGDLDFNLTYPLPIDQMGSLFKSLSQQVLVNSLAVRNHFFGEHDSEIIKIEPCPAKYQVGMLTKPLTPHISLVGSLHPGKGAEVFLRALAELDELGVEFTASLRGPGSQARVDVLQSLIQLHKLERHVEIKQGLRTTKELYEDVSIVVIASMNEAFGRVPFEATNFGCAVVYSASGGIPEYMIDGITGLGFVSGNSSELANQLKKALDNPELVVRLVHGAKEHLLSSQRQKAVLDQIQQVFAPGSVQNPNSLLQVILESNFCERDSLVTERDSLVTERDSLVTERDSLQSTISWRLTRPLRLGYGHWLAVRDSSRWRK